MKYHPMIFSAESVRAVLRDAKTQTRRVIVPQPDAGLRGSVFVPSGLEDGHGREIRTPYYPEDRIWLKETWAQPFGESGAVFYRADGPDRADDGPWKSPRFMPRRASRITLEILFARPERLQEITEEDARAEGAGTTDVDDDYVSEIERGTQERQLAELLKGGQMSARFNYWMLWDDLNARRGYPWESNPWIWRIEFKRIEP